jgi:Insect pheromone-binding family, A10/OS-D
MKMNNQSFKGLVSYFITTKCNDCSPEMKQATRRSISYLQKYYRRDWLQLNAKYKTT